MVRSSNWLSNWRKHIPIIAKTMIQINFIEAFNFFANIFWKYMLDFFFER